MAEIQNENNPVININVPASGNGQGNPVALESFVAVLGQYGASLTRIQEMLQSSDILSLSSAELEKQFQNADAKTKKSIEKLNKTIKTLLESENSPMRQELQGLSDKLDSMMGVQSAQAAALQQLSDNQLEILRLLTRLTERTSGDQPIVMGPNGEPTVAPAEPTVTPVAPTETVTPVTPTEPTADPVQPTEQPVEPAPVESEPTTEPVTTDPTTPVAPTTPVTPGATGPATEPTSEPVAPSDPTTTPVTPTEPVTGEPTTGDPEPVDSPEDVKKYKKAKFLNVAVKQTKILPEPKRPWYKRLGKFAVNHPVLTALAGAGVGLGMVGAAVGITAAAGVAGILSYANFFLPSFVIGGSMGAAAGGSVSLVSRLFPSSKRERLYKKFAKNYKKSQRIDRAKAIAASIEERANKAKQAAREKHRTASPILKSLKVHRIARNYHKAVERLSRKAKRFFTRKYVATVEKAVETKADLNLRESQSGKTMALAGYIQKRKKAQDKLAAGKISQEDYDEKIQDYAEDVADLSGGQEGFEQTSDQMYTYDYEAEKLIESVKESQRSKGMEMMLENIKKRNSKVVEEPVDRIYRDPEQVEAKIAALRAEGKTDEADLLQIRLDELMKQRQEYVDWATEHGQEIDEPVDVDQSEMTE